ncbi:MAG: hypothetical protein KC656_01325 [Myxococcales bacterium]|nr:hypothetical protein [Myxococcales bacterium]MCB9672716.1 hypothetical protein [Alphaproteobacteria bacterium]MCB9691711.1 hypothetical protein [Alphaproteobacteria bacterium]
MALELGESWPAWHPDVRRASWSNQGVEQDVLAVLGPHVPGAVRAARDGAADAMSYRGKHVLPLLAVEPTGREVAWVYPAEVLVAVGRLPDGALGPRAVAEIVRDVARTLEDLPHPGPALDDVLLDQRGTVRLAGFVGPWTPPAGYVAPGSGVPGADQVYRLGALLAELLGTPMHQAPGAVQHEGQIRRALINAMSIPDVVFPEPYRDLLRDLLAWDPRDRPTARQAVRSLTEVARTTGGPTLAEVVRDRFPSWLAPHRRQAPSLEELADLPEPEHDATMEVEPSRTLDGEGELGDLREEDDPTVDSELGVAPGSDRTPTSAIEHGSLPLRVGPPAEAVRRTPRLPEGFIGTPRRPPVAPAPADPPSWLTWLGVVLLACALGMSLWLLFG